MNRFRRLVASILAVALPSACGGRDADADSRGGSSQSAGDTEGETSAGGTEGTSTSGTTADTSTGTGDTGTEAGASESGSSEGGVCTPAEGTFADCLHHPSRDAVDACGNDRAVCRTDAPDDPADASWGFCTLIDCIDDCDCFAGSSDGDALPRCVEGLVPGDETVKICVLSCADGQMCPEGTFCAPEVEACVYGPPEIDTDSDTGTGTGETSGTDSGTGDDTETSG